MHRYVGKRICTLMVLLMASHAHAVRDRNFFSASRALAMGDAYTAYNAGFEAIYYNPAGVAQRSKPKFKLLDLEATGSQALVIIFKDMFSDLLNFQGLATRMAERPGQPIAAGVSLLPQFMVKNFSIGMIARGQSEGFIDPTSLDMNMATFVDIGAYVHYGAALFNGIVKIGAGAKLLDRAEVDRVFTAAEYGSALSFPDQFSEGTGVGFDAGVMITLPFDFLPTIGVAVQDIGGTDFTAKKVFFASENAPNVAPNTIPQKINVGYAMKIKHARGTSSGLSFEIKDVQGVVAGRSYFDRFHAGWELNVRERLFLRAGLNQGRYWTAGFGLGIGGVGLELSTYGENISTTGTRVSDRKWVGRYVVQF